MNKSAILNLLKKNPILATPQAADPLASCVLADSYLNSVSGGSCWFERIINPDGSFRSTFASSGSGCD